MAAARGVDPTPKNIERLAAAHGPEVARWAFLQWQLRERAKAKFARAEEMLFDRPGLEMSTHERVAAYHASRFPAGELIADLTCGIGADLIALAQRGQGVGFELDPQRSEYAKWNLAVHGASSGSVRVEDCLAAEWSFKFAFADPARRTQSARTWNPQEFEPHPIELAKRFESLELAGMKLSPMIRDDFFRHLPGELEFVSFGGECREAVVWMGRQAGRTRSAVLLGSADFRSAALRLEAAIAPAPKAEAALRFLYEADPAAIRAHALGTLAVETRTQLLGDSNGYLTSDAMVENPWLTGFEVLADHPADLRQTNQVLRSLNAGTPVIKSRVPRLEAEQLRRQFRGDGRELIVAVYPVGKKLRHAVLQRL